MRKAFLFFIVALLTSIASSAATYLPFKIATSSLYPWQVWSSAIPAVPACSNSGCKTYYVAKTGSDSNNGLTVGAPFLTIGKALTVIAAGDTVLIKGGTYREPINLDAHAVPTGTAAHPITIGSYGDSEVIVDGSTAVTGWANVSGNVWSVTVPAYLVTHSPIAIVANESPLKQVRQNPQATTAPGQTVSAVTSNSGLWFYNYSTHLLTADFGASIGAANPNSADVVVIGNDDTYTHVYWFGQNYVTFNGLTIRGSGGNGAWGYGSNNTFINCNIKYNAKAAVSWLVDSGNKVNSGNDNAVLYTNVYQNVMINWPRGNNGNAEAAGGWPGTVVWDANLRPVARGNIVYMNGGEGIISYGTITGKTSGSALFEQNVSYDNWSVNMYFDNQPSDVARQNFLYNHPTNTSNFIYAGANFPFNGDAAGSLDKFSVCIMLADEQNSSDNVNNFANLNLSQVYNNIMAGCRIGLRDYSEGATSILWHGIKNSTIANNTIIMPTGTFAGGSTYGIYLQDNKTPSGTQRNTNSVIENTVIYGYNSDSVIFTELTAAQGITINYNNYYSATAQPFGSGFNTVVFYNFAGWQSSAVASDVNSIFSDPLLVDRTAFGSSTPLTYDYSKANLTGSSPGVNTGTSQAGTFTNNFTGATRSGWNIGAF